MIDEALGEKPPFAANPGVNLLAARLEATDGVAKRTLQLALNLKKQMKVIGHNRAIDRLEPRRKLAHLLEVIENRPTELAVNDLGFNSIGLKPQPLRLANRNPLCPGGANRLLCPGGASRRSLDPQLPQRP